MDRQTLAKFRNIAFECTLSSQFLIDEAQGNRQMNIAKLLYNISLTTYLLLCEKEKNRSVPVWQEAPEDLPDAGLYELPPDGAEEGLPDESV